MNPIRWLLIVTCLLTLLLESCGTQGNTTTNKGLVFGFTAASLTDPGVISFMDGMKCYAKKHNATINADDAHFDANQQITSIDTFIAQQVDVIVVTAVDTKAISNPLAQAKSANIPVVEFFNPASKAPGVVYENSQTYGQDELKHIQQRFPGGTTAVVIGGPPAPTITNRIAGFVDNAASAGVRVLETVNSTGTSVDEGRKLAEDLLTKHPSVNVIFTWVDSLAIGAGLAVKARGLKNVEVVGANVGDQSIQAIKDGTITAAYDPDLFTLGENVMQVGEKLKSGQKVSPSVTPLKRWDMSNVNEWVPSGQRCV